MFNFKVQFIIVSILVSGFTGLRYLPPWSLQKYFHIFSRGFVVIAFSFSSLIHLNFLLFLLNMLEDEIHFPYTFIQLSQSYFLRFSFSYWHSFELHQNVTNIYVEVCLWNMYSFPLVYLTILKSVPYNFDHCSLMVNFEMKHWI